MHSGFLDDHIHVYLALPVRFAQTPFIVFLGCVWHFLGYGGILCHGFWAPPGLRMRPIPSGVATLDVVPCARLHLGLVVHHILFHWTPAGGNLESLIPVSTPIHQDLFWWLRPPSPDCGFPLLSLTPLVLTTHVSSLGWGAVLGDLTAQGL
ncbi:hypothetical protein NDU88_002800 [Pleurodeles waltl]|uniref:Uncharacterized protein n=1 Tax=Pleurodeles waltl TaxID=8319 RepID=A0AAV7REG9_PLEWA|nr:hypothetical protein NDU88_002800 [Pleurodeles waltl]